MKDKVDIGALQAVWEQIPTDRRAKYEVAHHFFVAVRDMYSGLTGEGVAVDLKKSFKDTVRQMYFQLRDPEYALGFTDEEIERISDKLKSMGWGMHLPFPLATVKACAGVGRDECGARGAEYGAMGSVANEAPEDGCDDLV